MTAKRSDPQRKLLIAAVAAVCVSGGVFATAGQAQLGDTGVTLTESPAGVGDTDYTPVAKLSERWQWVAGARYRDCVTKPCQASPDDVPDESLTPFELDLFDVAFRDKDNGFAGGAQCAQDVPDDAPGATEEVRVCERVPVIYGYALDAVGDPAWREAFRAEGRGYIGAIQWLTGGRALAVGGDGCYARREQPCPDGGTAPGADPAGHARAWLYQAWDDGAAFEWRELTGLPDAMRGLSALGTSPRIGDCDEGEGESAITTAWGCAVAGGLGQLWHFRDGRFVRGISGDGSTAEAPDRGELFQFRVRDVKFVASPPAQYGGLRPRGEGIRALAATAGCCATDALRNGPRLLVWDGADWHVRQREGDGSSYADALYGESQRRPVGGLRPSLEGSYDSTRAQVEEGGGCRTVQAGEQVCPRDVYERGWSFGGAPVVPPLEPETGEPWPLDGKLPGDVPNPAQAQTDAVEDAYGSGLRALDSAVSPYGGTTQNPDSYYALYGVGASEATRAGFSAVASAGGPAPAADAPVDEGASALVSGEVRLERPGLGLGNQRVAPTTPNQDKLLTTVRLVSADRGIGLEAVGVARGTGQGAAWGPFEPGEDSPGRQTGTPLGDPAELHRCDSSATPPSCDPGTDRFMEASASRNLFRLPSYALNAVDVLDDPADQGAGWAVGDHGAILSLAGQTSSQAQLLEPDAPELGAREPGALPDTSVYDAFRPPPTAEPGTLPPLAAREIEDLGAPRFVLRSSFEAGAVHTIVMSRDGTEGWAFGASSLSAPSLFHFDGNRWRSCSRPGPVEASGGAPCPDLGPLAGPGVGGKPAVDVLAAARIPLERDDDPDNDDELAVFAQTSAGPMTYRGGRWRSEQGQPLGTGAPLVNLTSVAFVAPDDGWATGYNFSDPPVYRFDGERWTRCRPAPKPECADPEGRLQGTLEGKPTATGGYSNDHKFQLAVAGERVYLLATRRSPQTVNTGVEAVYPMIVYRDPGGAWRGSEDGSDGGYDPGYYRRQASADPVFKPPPVHSLADPFLGFLSALATLADGAAGGGDPAEGRVYSVSVGPDGRGGYSGWAIGEFGGKGGKARSVAMRLDHDRWTRWQRTDAADDYLRVQVGQPGLGLDPRRQLTLDGPGGGGGSFAFPAGEPPIGFNPGSERWEALDTPFVSSSSMKSGQWRGDVNAVAPDGRGGFWAFVNQKGGDGSKKAVAFYRYTGRAPRPVLREVASPVPAGQRLTTTAAGADGSFWLATESSVLYRHDRMLGWNSVRIPGWDPGKTVTNPSPVRAVALDGDGRGVAVGPGGRIANISPGGAQLDAAAGRVCALAQPAPPCGTGRDLVHAAVADGGSVLVAGNTLTSLLWRPARGDFRLVAGPPRQPRSTRITGLALASADRAYLLLDGRLFAGDLEDESWSWRLELDADRTFGTGAGGIRELRVGPDGHGYALAGDSVLERTGDGDAPWRRLDAAVPSLSALAAPAGGGAGLIVGGKHGAVWTLQRERFEPAQPGDAFAAVNGSYVGAEPTVVGLGLSAGSEPGQVEAWAAVQDRPNPGAQDRNPAAHVLLHYVSDPRLDPAGSVRPLPDAPAPRPGEIAFAAFGKQDCQRAPCSELGGNRAQGAIARRVNEELVARAGRAGGLAFAVFTGDQTDGPTSRRTRSGSSTLDTPLQRDVKQPRWAELVAGPLEAAGLPLFGAIGGQDLTLAAEACDGIFVCLGTRGSSVYAGPSSQFEPGAGSNLQWRAAMAAAPAPWTKTSVGESAGVRFERVQDPMSQPTPELRVADEHGEPYDPRPEDEARVTNPPSARTELSRGTATHYAFDVVDAASGEKTARLVFVDTSSRALATSDPQQEPQEPGGQQAWLERMVCARGALATSGGTCSREPGQQAIVVSNTPTYTYANIDPGQLQQDASLFESILIRNRANMVVSGRLGWMGRYWALAPGVHSPCAGEGYREQPPQVGAGADLCGQGAGQAEGLRPAEDLAAELQGTAAPALPPQARDVAETKPWTLPFVVSSAAGGKFAPAAEQGDAGPGDGFWQGYQVVRLDASGDPLKTIVEQRPVLDWIAIRSQAHVLRPGQKMTLRGYGRQVYGQDRPARYVAFDSPAITHRYDLVLADPERPHLPFEDANGDYVPLPAQVATVDRQSGALKVGRGRGERTYAVGLLSVGDKVATRPVAFEPRRSFVPARQKIVLPAIPRAARAPAAQQPIRLTDTAPPPPPAPPATPATPISSTSLQAPQPPQFPSLPTVNPAGPPPAPTLNAPPPPPPPPPAPGVPPQQQPQPLALGAKVQAVAIVPSVNPLAPPPVNPAPPGGAAARKEAKQRQAATAKSEEGSSSDAAESGGDLAQGGDTPNGVQATRRAPDKPTPATRRAQDRPQPSYSTIARPEQASAWSRGALYGGGFGLAAAALALGFSILRPRPRRRPPEVPAPAWNRLRR